MNKLFLDTDVLLDLLLDREPFAGDIHSLMERSLLSETRLCASPISITNINYLISKFENQRQADIKTQKILSIVSVENVGQEVITQASDSLFKDFEDGVQNYCAQAAGHRIIITRNTKDYQESNLSILTPKEYLAKLNSE